MKRIISTLSLLTIVSLLSHSCKKKEIENSALSDCQECREVTCFYDNREFLLTVDADNSVIPDQNYEAFQMATKDQSSLVEFAFGGNDDQNRTYFFNTEYEGYEYVEDKVDKLLGRKFKFSYRIDELRNQLKEQYGDRIDYMNESTSNDVLSKIQAIYTEQHFTGDLPTDLEAFVGIKQAQFSPDRSDILTVYEHPAKGGASLCVETSPAASIVNYGPYGCYTMAALAELGNASMNGSTSWNDQISSAYCNFVSGASAMAVGFNKHSHFLTTSCNSKVFVLTADNGSFSSDLYVYNFASGYYYNTNPTENSAWWCGSMDNTISSVRVKAVWSGCQSADQFDDMYQ